MGDPSVSLVAVADGLREALADVRFSRLYRTAPIGPPQPDFLNAAIRGTYRGSPTQLLETCLRLEAELGRVRPLRWGPRIIDLDILWISGVRVSTSQLTVPHPRLHQRAFALHPLLDVAPDAEDPGSGRLYSGFVDDVADQHIERLQPVPPWWPKVP